MESSTTEPPDSSREAPLRAEQYANLRSRFLFAVNQAAEAHCRLEQEREEHSRVYAELVHAKNEAKRLTKFNCELKYQNKRLSQKLDKQEESAKSMKQMMEDTVSDIRDRFSEIEKSIFLRTADTVQIVHHLQRLVECIGLSWSKSGTAPQRDVNNITSAMSRALQQLEKMYNGSPLLGFSSDDSSERSEEQLSRDSSNSEAATISSPIDDSSIDEEPDTEREILRLQLENRQLHEEILDLQWQLKRSRSQLSLRPKLSLADKVCM